MSIVYTNNLHLQSTVHHMDIKPRHMRMEHTLQVQSAETTPTLKEARAN